MCGGNLPHLMMTDYQQTKGVSNMSKDIIWVAQKDGSWISNRIRTDKIDIAFTVYSGTDEYNSRVVIREAWYSNVTSRAVRKTGVAYFSTSREAKSIIKELINKANLAINAETAKTMLYAGLMEASLTSRVDGTGTKCANVFNIDMASAPTVIIASTPSTPTVANDSPVVSIKETINTVTTKVEEVLDLSKFKPGDHAPAGYIWIGKELTKIGWPS